MDDLIAKIKHWFIINDVEEISEVMSVVITVTSLVIGLLWIMLAVITGALEYTGLIWIIRGIVILAIANTIRMLIRDRRDRKEIDDEYSDL